MSNWPKRAYNFDYFPNSGTDAEYWGHSDSCSAGMKAHDFKATRRIDNFANASQLAKNSKHSHWPTTHLEPHSRRCTNHGQRFCFQRKGCVRYLWKQRKAYREVMRWCCLTRPCLYHWILQEKEIISASIRVHGSSGRVGEIRKRVSAPKEKSDQRRLRSRVVNAESLQGMLGKAGYPKDGIDGGSIPECS